MARRTWPVLLALLGGAHGYSCPSYDTLVQPSLAPEVYRMEDMTGIWYVVATNEPTIPTDMMRRCGILNWTVYPGDYRYTNTVTQLGMFGSLWNITIQNAGHRSKDPARPGMCRETIGIFNHTMDRTMTTNMFFNYSANDFYMSYACIGSVFGYSFILGSRSWQVSEEWIQEKIGWANATGLLDLKGVVTTSEETRRSLCWGQKRPADIVV